MRMPLEQKDTLHLSLKGKPFEVMETGEKLFEVRNPSAWIKSRLIGKTYNKIKFTNGYGKHRPSFTADYVGWIYAIKVKTSAFSNGLLVHIHKGDIVIHFSNPVADEQK